MKAELEQQGIVLSEVMAENEDLEAACTGLILTLALNLSLIMTLNLNLTLAPDASPMTLPTVHSCALTLEPYP